MPDSTQLVVGARLTLDARRRRHDTTKNNEDLSCLLRINSPVSRDGCSCLPSASRHALLAKDLVTWQAMVGRHILEDIVGRVAQYVEEHYPVDKWHLGDLIAWVAQSALKYRPRICELSKCLEGPLKMIMCPKKLLPTLSHLVILLYAARQ
ncbi:hypothetical protein TNCV_1114281 [Trichonephila clavipes]|nr:hypothetical protein TNCV_1114281 [Trichonephila clavipes]